MTNQDSNQNKTPVTTVTPDFSHRCADYPENEIAIASNQIKTVLSFIYPLLEPKSTLPPAHVCTVERLHADNESLKEQIINALFIVDSLNRDIHAIAETITTAK